MVHVLRSCCRLVALLAASSAIATAHAQPGPEHARLTAMSGTWDVEMTIWSRPGGRGLTVKGVSTIQSIMSGLFIEEKIEGAVNGATFATQALTGYNTSTRKYEATRISSSNPARIAESGGFDEKTNQFELKADYALGADTWHQRTVIQQMSPDSMIATSYLSFGAVPEWKGVEIKYTRKAR